ncbi:pyridoxamine 5'-phosphate oxidase family protein [Kineosporia sp. R_H_3]|uniref:pyridoxamine 5'-phosphate oxidase family protein n=1 Tax=Kineosporia sp. R_H_3 TaxID=1961848 RepID=UPI00117BC3D2|nr:pyridoxamine 5'-phosphate oxidase family protein [Kineosporia sp. R_H_3]
MTRDVLPEAVADLYRAAPRACLAVVLDGSTRLLPVQVQGDPAALTVTVAAEDADRLDGARAQVMLDDGIGWFALRAVAVRGVLRCTGDDGAPGRATFRLAADRTVCWDYGALRPVGTPAPAPDGRSAEPLHRNAVPTAEPQGDGDAPGDALRFVRASRVLVLGTTSPGGMPFATPIWFVPDRGGVLRVTSGGSSWAGRNVTTHPDVTLLLGGERGRADRRRLLVEGTAVVRSGLPPLRTATALAARYYLAPHELATELRHLPRWRFRQAYYAQHGGEPGHLEVAVRRARFVRQPGDAPAEGSPSHLTG